MWPLSGPLGPPALQPSVWGAITRVSAFCSRPLGWGAESSPHVCGCSAACTSNTPAAQLGRPALHPFPLEGTDSGPGTQTAQDSQGLTLYPFK